MENIKQIIAKNLVELRKGRKMTQQELAAKLNYSDKAISRWEHAETLPDIETLCRVCDIYGVRFEYLLQSEQPSEGRNPYVKQRRSSKIVIAMIAIMSVWLIASVAFMYLNVYMPRSAWLVFIWAIPAACAVGAICNHKGGGRVLGTVIYSLLSWSMILALYLQMLVSLGHNMWMMFLVGVPLQAIIILSLFKGD